MDNYESNCMVLRAILYSCLSDINKLIPLWHYGVFLSKEEEKDCSLSFILNLKQLLESCGCITIKYNNIKFVIDASGHGSNYSWSMFR